MPLFIQNIFRVGFAILFFILLTGGSASAEVQSLYQVKQELISYKNKGQYERDIRRVTKNAIRHLNSHKTTEGKLAIVLDIDETTLSNWKELSETGFCFNKNIWNQWIKYAQAPAIKPMLELYNHAKDLGIKVFFITGRNEIYRADTVKNLKYAGYANWEGLIMEKKGSHYTLAESYKTAERKKIVQKGFRIILNMGDQESDLAGGYADATFKLPNPFYYIP